MACKPLHHKENRRFSQKPLSFSAIKHYSTKAFYQVAAPKTGTHSVPLTGQILSHARRFCGGRLFTFCCICNNSISQQIIPMVIYSCIYNIQPTNNTFVYFSNKCLYQASLSLLFHYVSIYSPFCTSFFLFGRIYQFFPTVFVHIF